MNFYTIKPLAEAFNHDTRSYLKFGDLVQIEAKVRNQHKKKLADPRQEHSAIVEENYLKILAYLKVEFNTQTTLPKARLLALTDKFIKDNQFTYLPKRHRVARKTLFYDKADKVYDVAFYHPQATNIWRAHHEHNGRKSVFYARFEEKADHILIGNIQIDDRHARNTWAEEDLRAIMLMKKNIYRAMLQESLKIALQSKKPKILFQTGESNHYTQKLHENYQFKKIKITNANYPRYLKDYEQWREKFDQLQPGDWAMNFSYGFNGHGMIIEKSAEAYRSLFSCYSVTPDNLFTTINMYYNNDHVMEFIDLDADALPEASKINRQEELLDNCFEKKNYRGMVRALDKIFKIIDPQHQETQTADKVAYLKEHYGKWSGWRPLVDNFLIKFKYQDILLRQFPFMKAARISPEVGGTTYSGWRFYDTRHEKYLIDTFAKSSIMRPEVGRTFLLDTRHPDQLLLRSNFFEKEMYNFYDKELPKLFAGAGLKFKRTIIRTKIKGQDIKSAAWEIKTGVSKFKESPLIIF